MTKDILKHNAATIRALTAQQVPKDIQKKVMQKIVDAANEGDCVTSITPTDLEGRASMASVKIWLGMKGFKMYRTDENYHAIEWSIK